MQTALVERARDGDQEAFNDLVALTGDRCYAIAFRITRDPFQAQDAVQQAYVLAWRSLPQLRDLDRFDAWLYRLLVNACYEEGRRQRRWSHQVRSITDEVMERASPDPVVSVDDRDALDRAFRRLSPDHRAVFVLHHYVGVPLPVIANVLGVPVGTVKSRLHRATRALREALILDSRLETAEVRPA